MILICPSCRVIAEDRVDLTTLSQIDRGFLQCENPNCRKRYPIVHGIALVGVDLATWLPTEALALLAQTMTTQQMALLALAGDDTQPIPRWLEHLSIYVDAHYGDRARPEAEDVFGYQPLAEKIAARAASPVDVAVDLGCSVGRGLFELGRGAKQVYGLDRNAASLRAAATLLGGHGLPYGRRVIGRQYAEAEATPPGPPPTEHLLVACDILDPPLPPRFADRVLATNVIDAVRSPTGLLCVIDGLLKPGGEALLATPYAWTSGYTDEEERLGSEAPDATLKHILQDGLGLQAQYRIDDEDELDWKLRRDKRLTHHYRVHYLRVTKLETAGTRG